MPSFRISPNSILKSKYYRRLINPLMTKWGWLIAFLLVSSFNGWFLNIANAPILLVVYFGIFPLSYLVSFFSKKTSVLVASLIISRAILAFGLYYLNPEMSPIGMGWYVFNFLLFAFILIYVALERGIVIPALIAFTIVVLLVSSIRVESALKWAFHIIWYCNLIVSANKAGRQMRKALDSFDNAMLFLSGIASLGLALGWTMGRSL